MEALKGSCCDPLYVGMEGDYEGAAYERGFEQGVVDGESLGYEEGFKEGFLAAIPVASEIVQLRSRLEEIMLHLNDQNHQGSDRVRQKAGMLLAQVQKYILENIEDGEREMTLSSIKIRLRQLLVQAGLNKALTCMSSTQESGDGLT